LKRTEWQVGVGGVEGRRQTVKSLDHRCWLW